MRLAEKRGEIEDLDERAAGRRWGGRRSTSNGLDLGATKPGLKELGANEIAMAKLPALLLVSFPFLRPIGKMRKLKA
jgi:hypothetical protein